MYPDFNRIWFASKIFFTVVLFLSLIIKVYAQPLDHDSSSNAAFSIGLKSHYGFIIPHSTTIKDISDSKPCGTELDVSWHFTDNNSWQYFYSYPRVGATLTFINFGNPEVLGSGLTAVAYVEPVLGAQNKINFSFRLGTGLAFLSNVYHPEKNPTNLFYSTPVSFVMMGNAGINYRVMPNLQIRGAFYYNHISNGGTKEPNKGINYPTASLGLDYTFNPQPFRQRTKEELANLHSKNTFIKTAIIGVTKTAFPDEKKRYPIYGITGYVSHIFGRINAVTGGLEVIADRSQLAKIRRSDNPDRDYHRVGLLIGHEFLVGRFVCSQQFGVYLYSPYPPRDPVYQRIGLEFKISDNIFVGTNLKVHRHVADFLDLRLGYSF